MKSEPRHWQTIERGDDIHAMAQACVAAAVEALAADAIEAEVTRFRVWQAKERAEGKYEMELAICYRSTATFQQWIEAAAKDLVVESGPGTIRCEPAVRAT